VRAAAGPGGRDGVAGGIRKPPAGSKAWARFRRGAGGGGKGKDTRSFASRARKALQARSREAGDGATDGSAAAAGGAAAAAAAKPRPEEERMLSQLLTLSSVTSRWLHADPDMADADFNLHPQVDLSAAASG
jgi:hypothetical protein